MNRTCSNLVIAFACLASSVGAALAQTRVDTLAKPGLQPPGLQEPLRPVDPGVADVGPLSESFRDMRVDLRQPVGFENVYRLPGHEELLMRSSGALYAVFPQSAYVQTQRGPVPIIPAGTVFYIGDPTQAMPRPPLLDDRTDELNGPISTRVRARRDTYLGRVEDGYINTHAGDRDALVRRAEELQRSAQPQQMQRPVPDASSAMAPTIATDENYRAQRIAELLARAADAAHAHPEKP